MTRTDEEKSRKGDLRQAEQARSASQPEVSAMQPSEPSAAIEEFEAFATPLPFLERAALAEALRKVERQDEADCLRLFEPRPRAAAAKAGNSFHALKKKSSRIERSSPRKLAAAAADRAASRAQQSRLRARDVGRLQKAVVAIAAAASAASRKG